MARKKTPPTKPVDPEERARLKKLKSLQRREARKLNRESASPKSDPERTSTGPLYSDPTYQRDDYEWIRNASAKAYANKIMNSYRERPYWLSIPRNGSPPTAHLFPCNILMTEKRVYYGFLFREHREMIIAKWPNARREFTEVVDALRRG